MTQTILQPCRQCGRLLSPGEDCPNCAVAYPGLYTGYSTGAYRVAPEPTVPRWVLLMGSILLLLLLFAILMPRTPSPVLTSQETDSSAPHFPPPPPFVVSSSPISSPATPQTTPQTTQSKEEALFWRKKAEKDLRDAGEYVPTKEEEAYWNAVRWQNHSQTSAQTRTTDFYLRRPELVRPR